MRTWLLLLPTLAYGAESAQDLFARAVAAERDNRMKARNYLFREVIRFSEVLEDGSIQLKRANTYEVTFLDGEPVHRLTAINGEALSPQEFEKEQERIEKVAEFRRKIPIEERRRKTIREEGQRFRIDIRMVEKYHDIALAGETEMNGRRVWILETSPRPGTRKPKNRMEWTLSQRCRYWVDQETLHPIRLESTQAYDWDGVGKDSLTETVWTRVDDLWLVAQIRSTNITQRGKHLLKTITDQLYSNYRRFQSDSVITFDDQSPPDHHLP